MFGQVLGGTSVTHIPLAESDHVALSVLVQGTSGDRTQGRRKPRPFRYEDMWKSHSEYSEFVNRVWDPGAVPQDLTNVAESLRSLQGSLQCWDREVFGSVKKQVRDLRAELEHERQINIRRGPSAKEKELISKLSVVLDREETMERQRSRVAWLREGDRNTEFFQSKARARGRTNSIRSLTDSNGQVVTKQEDLERLACAFYQNLFTAQQDVDPALICQYVPRRVTEEMITELDREFTEEEVERALFQMKPGKAPGADGFNAGFFQTHWSLVKQSVVPAVLAFLNGGVLPGEVNKTLLVLIPKVANPQDLSQYRPISLCNVIYKLCSKTMANRMRRILDEIISEEQSAFVPGRLITDNALIAHECIHYLNNKKGKVGSCAVKLDMAKAYDRVEWSYLRAVMEALGFSRKWCDLVMQCVTSVTFAVRVNGVFSDFFQPTRGIRQGDPISPYLFLLCSEGLTCMLKNIGPLYAARGVRVGRHSPWISHLLFADDCLIFTQASQRAAERVSGILEHYNRGSGQLVNKNKSAVFFSANCDDDAKRVVHDCLQIPNEALGEKYLGLPTMAGRGNTGAFQFIMDRSRYFVGGWAEKTLSCAAKEVLIKSNLQAVPTYSMSCFKLPPAICRKLTSHASNYWWGSSLDNHKIHWQSWEKLTRPKHQGGIGFRDFQLFNKAMLGKQGWRLMTRQGSLCERVLKGKYYPNGDFLNATKKKKASTTWRSLVHGRDVLYKGMIKRIGPGNVNVWNDSWIPGVSSFRPVVRLPTADVERVHELFVPGTRVWDVEKVKRNFIGLEADAVLQIKPGTSMEDDIDAWAFERHGSYSVRSAYRMLKQDQTAQAKHKKEEAGMSMDSAEWKKVWKLHVPPKVRSFWWRVLHDFLPAKAELKRRHVAKESFCESCGNPVESLYHIIFECSIARRFWEEAQKVWGLKIPHLHPVTWPVDTMNGQFCSSKEALLVICGAWTLWTGRNRRRNGRSIWQPGQAVRYISNLLEELALVRLPVREAAPKVKMRWKTPTDLWVKVNTDGGFCSEENTGTTGFVIRDAQGDVQAAGGRWFDHVPDALMAEALAAKEGLELATEVGCDRVILETDSSVLHSMLSDRSYIHSAIGGVCRDIKDLSAGFVEFKIAWVRREANTLAHSCAKKVNSVFRSMFWLDEIPEWLKGLASADCNLQVE
jgi:ribonuclease HI